MKNPWDLLQELQDLWIKPKKSYDILQIIQRECEETEKTLYYKMSWMYSPNYSK